MLPAKFELAASLAVAFAAAGAAQETRTTRVDSYGDPLPNHALFRIGTTRLQHAGEIRDLAVSDDGRLVASLGNDKTIRVWDAKDGKPIWKFDLPSWGPWALAFARDSKQLTAVSAPPNALENSAIHRWDMMTGRALRNDPDMQREPPDRIALACKGNGEWLAAVTSAAEPDITLFVVGDPKSGRRLKGHTERLMRFAFTNDAKTLVSLGSDGMIRFWNTDNGKEFAKWPVPPLKDPGRHQLKGNLACITASPDGKTLALSLPDGSTRLLDAAGREQRQLSCAKQMNALAFSADGKALITGGNLIDWWNVDDAKPIKVLRQPRDPLLALSLSPDGKIAAYADDQDRLRMVDVATGKPTAALELPCRAGIAFAPNGQYLATAAGDDTVALWEIDKLRASEKTPRRESAKLLRGQAKVNAFAFSPAGDRIATVEGGKYARIYDIASKKTPLTIEPFGRPLYGVAFSANGKLLATIGEQPVYHHEVEKGRRPQSVGLWDSFSGKELPIAEDLRRLAHSIAFHPSGKLFAALHLPAAAKDTVRTGFDIPRQFSAEERMETTRLWNVEDSREKYRFDDPIQRKIAEHSDGWIIGRSRAVAAAFSPDGWLFAAASPRGIVVFETASGQPRLRLEGHLQEITGLVFTPEGATLVSTSRDSTLVIWDLTGLRTGIKMSGSNEELWIALADPNAEKAGRAVFAMVDSRAESVEFLRKRLRPVAVSQASLQKLVAHLDDASFAIRDKAERELAELGPAAEATLNKKLQEKPSLEATRRIQSLLNGIRSMRPQPEQIRIIRAVEVLERIGSQDARDFLCKLANGSDDAYQTIYAREALDRMNRRFVSKPAKKTGP